jgi:hypothetical protein
VADRCLHARGDLLRGAGYDDRDRRMPIESRVVLEDSQVVRLGEDMVRAADRDELLDKTA